ncbi:uncharacterized protein LW93_1587 [Fusarium fujikuroi]|nr:uncharacterized protein LW93_1587 [Fusarium fujikuroi]
MPTDQHEDSVEPTGDVEMSETQNTQDTAPEATQEGEENENAHNTELPFANSEIAEPRVTFANYLMSPIVTLLIGSGDQSILSAHQGLLRQSPYFKDICDRFVEDGSPRQIELPDYDIETVGSFLEYLYTGEYFPKKLPGQRVLESDPSVPSVDNSGDQLLKHARIYTLAEKFGVAGLKGLSSSKIHCQRRHHHPRPRRKLLASFWATRSHTLRAEAEEEFKALCLEHPQFGYDVLTRVLDDKLKRERNDKMHPATSSGRKRARHSSGSRAD